MVYREKIMSVVFETPENFEVLNHGFENYRSFFEGLKTIEVYCI